MVAAWDLKLLGKPQVPPGPGRSYSLAVRTERGRKLLKRYKHTVPVASIVHEHSILAYLAHVDFPAPHLVTTPAGETLVCHDGHNYALFDFIDGGFQYHNYFLLPAQQRQFIASAGEVLALLHYELRGFVPQGHNPNGFKSRQEGWWRDLDWYASRLTRCIEETRRLQASAGDTGAAWLLPQAGYLEELLYRLDAALKDAALPRLIIHGDYGPYNLLFRRGAPVTILDFEIARLDWRATELVDALWRFTYSRLGFSLAKMKWFLDAYRARFAVDADELRLLPAVWEFLNVRRCIVRWHHYCDTHEPQRLAQARWNLELIHWIQANKEAFMRDLGR
jgi:Ser/Thr protein kinase RdoA (MazF antagonist)